MVTTTPLFSRIVLAYISRNMNSITSLLVLLAVVWLSSANPLKKRTTEAQSKTFNLQSKTNFVVYWGSTDYEGKLSDYCTDNIYDVIILAFASSLDEDGVPQLSLDGCDGVDCSEQISQIQTCQNAGKTIMLSVGGADGSYVLTSADYAKKVAGHLWNMFLNRAGENHLFGQETVLDGVDFDIEQGAKEADEYWVTLINELRRLTNADTSKHYFLSEAPQCVFPDEWSVPCACSSKYGFRCTAYSLGSDLVLRRPSVKPILISYPYNSTTITVVFSPFSV